MKKKSKKDLKVKDESRTYYVEGKSIGMCLGMSIGTVVGIFVDNVSICMCFGISIGLCIGMGVGFLIEKDK